MKARKTRVGVPSALLVLLFWTGTAKCGEMNTGSSDPPIPQMTQEAIDRGLAYLAARQNDDGSFGDGGYGKNAGVVSLAGMAFLWSGSVPGEGKHGKACDRCLRYVLSQSQPDGAIAAKSDDSHGMMYAHALATSFLAEVYRRSKTEAVLTELKPAVQLIVQSQNTAGSWRYFPGMTDGDVSVTSCQIMALRDARRAGLEVPDEPLRKATEFVRKCQNPDGGFRYMLKEGPSGFARSAAAVAALAGASNDGPDVIAKGRGYLATFLPQGKLPREAWFSHGHYYAGWALWGTDDAQWRAWHKAVCQELLAVQASDGAWLDQQFGPEYATALACLTLQFPQVAGDLLASEGTDATVRAEEGRTSPAPTRLH